MKVIESSENFIKYRKHLRKIYIALSLVLLLIALFVFLLFRKFRSTTYSAMAVSNTEFTKEVDTLASTIDKFIIDYGLQLFYSDSIYSLMKERSFSGTTEHSYKLRELNGIVSTGNFIENIYILNDYNQHIYSTDPDQCTMTLDKFNNYFIKDFFIHRNASDRFKPIRCTGNSAGQDNDFYAYIFYELEDNRFPKPGIMVLTVSTSFYRNILINMSPGSLMLILDKNRNILMTSSETAENEGIFYIDKLKSGNEKQGYIYNKEKNQVCFYVNSDISDYIYLKIQDVDYIVPELKSTRNLVFAIIGLILIVLISFFISGFFNTVIPMIKMKETLKLVMKYQNRNYESDIKEKEKSSIDEDLNKVIRRSKRNHLEQNFYDMLFLNRDKDTELIFPDTDIKNKYFAIVLKHADHRRNIYKAVEDFNNGTIVAKSTNCYLCIALFEDKKIYSNYLNTLMKTVKGKAFASELFNDFSELTTHYNNLCELFKLSYIFSSKEELTMESELFSKTQDVHIDSNTLTALSVKLKNGNFEGAIESYHDIEKSIINYRYSSLNYVFKRLEKNVCRIYDENPERFKNLKRNLLEDNLIKTDENFQNAFKAISNAYKISKMEKYSDLAIKIRNYIDKNYTDLMLSSQTIADHFNMNNAYLQRQYKAAYNESIADRINISRIDKACNKLISCDSTIEDIARSVGFSNTKYFYTIFKNYIGMTPGKYRKMNKRKNSV